MQIDWRVKGGRPILHGGVVMRMGDGDRVYPAQGGNQRFAGGIKIGDAVPENIPLRR